jgi:hypothetical protein
MEKDIINALFRYAESLNDKISRQMDEKVAVLEYLTGMSLDQLIQLFKAGYVLEKPKFSTMRELRRWQERIESQRAYDKTLKRKE